LSIQACDQDPDQASLDKQPHDVDDPSAGSAAGDEQQAPTTASSELTSMPFGTSSSDAALHFPGHLPPNDFVNPSADEDEELSFPVDAPTVSCKVVENCHLEFPQEWHPDQLSEVKKGHKGIRDPSNPGSPAHLAQDAADAAVLMPALLLNEKPTSAMEARARTEGLPVQTWVCGVSSIAGNENNQHPCDTLLSPAGFANLKRILAKAAHTNSGALFKVQKKGAKTAATPFSNLWSSSAFHPGGHVPQVEDTHCQAPEAKSIASFLPHPEHCRQHQKLHPPLPPPKRPSLRIFRTQSAAVLCRRRRPLTVPSLLPPPPHRPLLMP